MKPSPDMLRRPRRGSVTPLVALCLVLVLGAAAIALDGGLLLLDRRRAHSVADAAALAAAADLYTHFPQNQGTDPNGTAASAARASAAANGYSNDGVSSVVTVNIPPTTGDHAGVAGYVEVIVQYNQSRGLSSVFGSGTISVQARAVARGLQTPYSRAGVLLLDPSSSAAFTVSGASLTVAGGAPVVVDSSSSQALSLTGNSSLTASQVVLSGNYSAGNNASIQGTVSTGQAATADPFTPVPVPDPTTLPTQSSSALTYSSGSHTLQPGIYSGGITLGDSASITLAPGVYYLNGGGLRVSDSASLSGQGVMIYNNPQQNTDTINLGGSATVNLSPPTSGPYQGLTLFQNRSSTAPVNLPAQSGNSITGTIYAPAARVTVGGPGSTALASQIVAADLTVNPGTSTITWNAGKVARIHDIRLCE